MISVIAICIGASLGALARWGLGLWLSPGAGISNAIAAEASAAITSGIPAAIPLGTLAANLIGGYLVGICVAVFQAMPQLDPVWRLALVTGFWARSPRSPVFRPRWWACCSSSDMAWRWELRDCTWRARCC